MDPPAGDHAAPRRGGQPHRGRGRGRVHRPPRGRLQGHPQVHPQGHPQGQPQWRPEGGVGHLVDRPLEPLLGQPVAQPRAHQGYPQQRQPQGRFQAGNRGRGGPQRGAASASGGEPNGHAKQEERRPREIGYRKLEELAEEDGVKIMQKLSEPSTLDLFSKLTSEQKLRQDWIRLIVRILAKLCQVEYQPIVVRLFHKICQQEFLDQLLLHIVQLGSDSDMKRRDSVSEFYKDFCTLSHGILKLSPNLASEKLDNLIKKASSELVDLSPFDGCDEVRKDLDAIKEKLKLEKERLESQGSRSTTTSRLPVFAQGAPPDDFRELPVFPTIDDLVPLKPYLRQNITKGPYTDVEHYLDVQFRLLREDFVRPLREGVNEYCQKMLELENAPRKKAVKVNNVRIYEKVIFLKVKTEDDRIGVELCFDPEQTFSKSINWEYSKRLMVGSLILLTRDRSFKSVILVTVSKRDLKSLEKGLILVDLCEGVLRKDFFEGHFLMVECQIFYGAYSHVLRALKELDEDSFPMKDYLVYASNFQQLPDYQEGLIDMKLPLPSDSPASHDDSITVDVNDFNSWPSADALGLDDSQYRAFRGAITNKLMLIQGPPGTGKTFLGLKVASCLLLNKNLWTSELHPRPMLVVCYTNHALDQFLTGLLPATNSIVRVGGGCKEPLLEEFSINNLRRFRGGIQGQGQLYRRIREQRDKLCEVKKLSDRFHACHRLIKENAGILSHHTLLDYNIITEEEHAAFELQPLMAWLGNDLRNYMRRFTGEVPVNPFQEVILSCDCLFSEENIDTGLKELLVEKDVTFILSFCKIEAAVQKLQEETVNFEQARLVNSLYNLLQNVRYGLQELQNLLPAVPQIRRRHQMWGLSYVQRWQLYRSWRDRFVAVLESRINDIDIKYAEAASLLQEWRLYEDQNIMSSRLVIGMTTSYAASRQRILKELKPRIVIVEEAAEVLEGHVLVSLAGAVQHLIMIGDHQQLRPNPAVYELAKKYHLDVSLFERLINNGVHCVSLSTQHRMRPEVARLICPAIYPNLLNHPSVLAFPDVAGVTKNVFFVDHSHPEEQVKDAQSYQNPHEAKFISCLVRHLLLQGHSPSHITVLSTYKGQQYFFSKLRQDEAHLKQVRITVVDNYQGEEADIILLSLVRSNEEDVVGFLKTENRVCVALSRARHGLYIVGNMANMTAKDTVWRKVKDELVAQGGFGAALTLCCPIHGTLTPVSSADDFAGCPQGGCLELCKLMLDCGHECPQVCHTQDREHRKFQCLEPCPKEVCPKRHICPDRCFEVCQPCKVPKVELLQCGHSAEMPCHRDPEDHNCQVKVTLRLPACDHDREMRCYQSAHLHRVPCLVPCTVRMNCGHVCGQNCHVLEDPDHEEYKCLKTCGKKKVKCSQNHICMKMCHELCEECNNLVEKELPCGHKAKMKCKEDPADRDCILQCERTADCGHKCRKKCHEPCAPCPAMVMKLVPQCGHTQKMECALDPALFTRCKKACERTLQCGHRCKRKCGDTCSSSHCKEMVQFAEGGACGHRIMVPCNKQASYGSAKSRELLLLCKEPCGTMLQCEHTCSGTCGTCLQGRFHIACQDKCERPLVCGHTCKEPCAVSCPPCKQKCDVKCSHSSCRKTCGEPCAVCEEPCERVCIHGRCPAPCGKLCPGESCSEACLLRVPGCGHACIGLCGDVCLCRECNEDKIEIFFGTEEDEDARFVVLPDCKHFFESSGLDHWMFGSDDDSDSAISMKVCPLCKTRVTTSRRYSNVVKQNTANVAKVKVKLFGNWKNIKPVVEVARVLWKDIPVFPKGFITAAQLISNLNNVLLRVEKNLQGSQNKRGARITPPFSLTEMQTVEQYIRIVKSIGEIIHESLHDPKFIESGKDKEIRDFVETLSANILKRSLFRLSPQEASDLNTEVERLQGLVKLCFVESGPGFSSFTSSDKEMYWSVSEALRGFAPYCLEKKGMFNEKLQVLAKKASVTITKEEIDTIVAAMGMRQGHWYKCPNGHPYCIADCGGAMVESRCNECGARIGGANHQLRRDNTIATEIDGATTPAWPTNMQY